MDNTIPDDEEQSNVIEFPIKECYTSNKIDPKGVLKGIEDHQLDTVIVLGYTKEGDEYFASSTPNGMEIIWLMERMKHMLMNATDNNYE